MADYCTKCNDELFGNHHIDPDIDVVKIFNELKPNHWISPFLCEGCTLYAIGKTIEGKLQILYYHQIEPVTYESVEVWLVAPESPLKK